MEFELSADQRALAEAAADLLEGMASSERVRALVGPGTGEEGGAGQDLAEPLDRELWRAMADQGWLGIEVPESEGGLGLGMVEVAVLCEQLGRRVAPAPFVPNVLCVGALGVACRDDEVSEAVRDELGPFVESLSEGRAIGCVAFADRSVTARSDGDRWLLTGRPEPTQYAPVADVAVVVAEDAVYALSFAGSERPPQQPSMDRTRPLGWLTFDATPAWRLGGPEVSALLADRAATACAAQLLGASERALEMSVEYAKVRRQFGHPIGSFQAVKHRLADALVDVEAMRSSAYYAAWCLASGDRDASVAASMAKAWCSDASRRVMASAMQVHGGIGFTWEYDLHLYVKRAQLDATSFGSASFHRD
ncbi:MAG TPA: acyl-CoA dehydrogenase family protein, partial [Acidimicrobiales bacterium]|nr:acyl-CoA dehydrogenase family protein [Acidimicrobiales bacterium]